MTYKDKQIVKNILRIVIAICLIVSLASVYIQSISADETKNPDTTFEGKKIGLVLTSGGLKGSYEVGAMAALKDMNLLDNIVAVSGASIGAFNAAGFAGSGLEALKDYWFDANLLKVFQLRHPSQDNEGIASKDGLAEILDECVDYTAVQNSTIDTYICASRENDGEKNTAEYVKLNDLDKDKMKQYLLASASIPSVFDPEIIDGVKYTDGGFTDNEPIKPIYDSGVRDFIVITAQRVAAFGSAEEYADKANICVVESKLTDTVMSIAGAFDITKYGVYYRYALGYYETMEIVSAHQEGREVNLKGLEWKTLNLANKMIIEANTKTTTQTIKRSTKEIIEKARKVVNFLSWTKKYR